MEKERLSKMNWSELLEKYLNECKDTYLSILNDVTTIDVDELKNFLNQRENIENALKLMHSVEENDDLVSRLWESLIAQSKVIEQIKNESQVNKEINKNHKYELNTHAFHQGSDWLFSYVDAVLSYDFKLVSTALSFTFFDDYFDYFFKVYICSIIGEKNTQLINSVLTDIYTYLSNIKLSPETMYLMAQCPTSLYVPMDHPELAFITKSVVGQYLDKYMGELCVALFNLLSIEVVRNAITMGMNLFIIMYFLMLGDVLYHSFFSSSTKEENLIDHDYMYLTITIEAEEEIASMDDILMLVCLLFGIFGWFFLANFWYVFMTNVDFSLLCFFFPVLFIIILLIPTLLLYSFGIHFVTYLRGVASVPVFILEQIFDYVAIKAFYIRILVQGVRLLLMTFVFVSLHDLILFIYMDQRTIAGNESIFDDLHNVWVSKGTTSYYFFWNILGTLFYWIYELFHTLFVLTAQFTAFFAMVFWLFFFLYTSFVLEKQEAYLYDKREQYNQTTKKNNPFKLND